MVFSSSNLSNSFSVVLKIFLSDPNFFSNFFMVIGPIPGNPSNMNCFCCSSVRLDLVCLVLKFCGIFSWRLAKSIRNFAVSDSFSV